MFLIKAKNCRGQPLQKLIPAVPALLILFYDFSLKVTAHTIYGQQLLKFCSFIFIQQILHTSKAYH